MGVLSLRKRTSKSSDMNIFASYVPVLHRGYVELFEKHRDQPLFIFDLELIDTALASGDYRVRRDRRALNPYVAKKLVESLDICFYVEILTEPLIKDGRLFRDRWILPKDGISEAVVAYARLINPGGECRVQFVDPGFIRWDVPKTANKVPVNSRVCRAEKFEKEIFGELSKEADQSPVWWRQVAACVVKDGKTLVQAHNTHMPDPHTVGIMGDPRSNFNPGERIDLSIDQHAEAALIAWAARAGESLEGTTLFVTTFPCPQCANLIAHSGIKKVLFREGYSRLDAAQTLELFGVELVRVEM